MERRDLEIEKVEVNSPLICINVNLREFNQRLVEKILNICITLHNAYYQ